MTDASDGFGDNDARRQSGRESRGRRRWQKGACGMLEVNRARTGYLWVGPTGVKYYYVWIG